MEMHSKNTTSNSEQQRATWKAEPVQMFCLSYGGGDELTLLCVEKHLLPSSAIRKKSARRLQVCLILTEIQYQNFTDQFLCKQFSVTIHDFWNKLETKSYIKGVRTSIFSLKISYLVWIILVCVCLFFRFPCLWANFQLNFAKLVSVWLATNWLATNHCG